MNLDITIKTQVLTAKQAEALLVLLGAPVAKAPVQQVEEPIAAAHQFQLDVPAHEPEEPPSVESTPEEARTYTEVEVRAIASAASKAKGSQVLRDAFAKFGVKKLTELKPDQYAAFVAEVE